MIRRFSAQGKTIAEYGLILALVVLVAIPGLQIMGERLQDFYQNREPISQADQLFGLLSGSGGGAGTPGTAATAASPAQASSRPALTATVNADGTVSLLNPDGSVATQSTSVDGTTRMVADSLTVIAETGQLPDGTAVPDDLRPVLQDLANKGYDLSNAEKVVLDVADSAMRNKKGKGKRPNIGKQVGTIVKDSTDSFSKKYEDFEELAKQYPDSPEVAKLREVVTGYSSVITHTASDFSDQMGLGKKESVDNKDLIGKSPEGQVSVELAPVVTDSASLGIENTAETAP